MLRVEHLCRRYDNGTEALRDVSLRLEAGEIMVLLGPSGCGKSTLLRLVAGLDPPQRGRIVWDHGPPPPGRLGFVFQDPTLLPWATAAQNVALPMRLRGVDPARALDAAAGALERVGLGGFARALPRELSGGMRMRVSLARSLVQRPVLLLMDEPFAALDEFTRNDLQDMLLALAVEERCAILFVTHSIYEAAFLGQRIVLMSPRPGRIAGSIAAALPAGPQRRQNPDYLALVAEVTARARQVREG